MRRTEAGRADERSGYIAYLLRLWRAGEGEGGEWRASVEDPHTGERRGFASLEALFAFLREQVGVSPAPNHEKEEEDPG
ncbi:MAG: hypothetical protein GXP39_08780 [Chloroflexi bacterium]|nr:hypothetical protein [Chloroflexota bacterium]